MADMTVNLAGRVALVTYAGAEIGRAVALALADSGAAICAHDINPARADHTVEAIQAAGGRAMAWVGDTSKRFQVSAMIESLRDEFGGLHILVNAASVDRRAAFLNVDEYDWQRVLDMNLTSAFHCAQLAGRVMADEGGGVIVNVTHTAGLRAHIDGAAFASSQAAIIGLTRESARALITSGIRVNAVCGGTITAERMAANPARIPQGHTGTPDEIARVVLFLCSAGASFMVGQTLVVDGGEGLL